MTNQQPHIELVIDKLLLHGFPPEQRQHIGDALEQELTRLFQERGIPPTFMSNNTLSSINGGTIQVAVQTRPSLIGSHVARALYSSLIAASGQQQVIAREQRGSQQGVGSHQRSSTNAGGQR